MDRVCNWGRLAGRPFAFQDQADASLRTSLIRKRCVAASGAGLWPLAKVSTAWQAISAHPPAWYAGELKPMAVLGGTEPGTLLRYTPKRPSRPRHGGTDLRYNVGRA